MRSYNNYVIPYNNLLLVISKQMKLFVIINFKNMVIMLVTLMFLNWKVKKLTFTDSVGDGFFAAGQNIRTRDTKAEVIGYSQARKLFILVRLVVLKRNGQDYFQWTFNAGASLNTYNEEVWNCMSSTYLLVLLIHL